ncbi:MAG: rhomboid family intramembrane serine protease, partial [Planctomycetota bacterium]|nr:rhomboid family intramembrane serine protease [Planctomycetota bacterium]
AYGAGGLRGMRMWSVNTWLIVICAIVFVIDGLTPLQTVEMGIEWAEGVNPAQLKGTDVVITEPAITLRGRGGQPIQGVRQVIQRTPGGPEVVGEQTVLFQHVLTKYLHFSTQRGFLRIEFWRFIGFQFLHANLMHLLFNMIGLYFFGPMVERYLGSKRYLAFYLLCGIFGALMYSLLNLGGVIAEAVGGSGVRVPGLLFNDAHTPLVGASAGVFGVLMAGAYLAPRAMVLVFFFLPMQLRTLAYALVGIALFTVVVAGRNAGGEAGHLGGAIAGFYFIRHPRHLHGFFDILGRVDPTSHHYRGKGAPARGRAVAKGAGARGAPSRAEVDRVLDKVHSQGLASLTDREKRILRQASERDG